MKIRRLPIPKFQSLEEEKAYWEARGPLAAGVRGVWHDRPLHSPTPETDDVIAKLLEMEAIGQYVKPGMDVLDLGCGAGTTLIDLCHKYDINALGIDSSKEMVELAVKQRAEWYIRSGSVFTQPQFICMDAREVEQKLFSISTGAYDIVITERLLVNIPALEDRRNLVAMIGRMLKPTGLYLMCENSKQGLEQINQLRYIMDLPEIRPPSHNTYMDENELDSYPEGVRLKEVVNYSGMYYFLSRVVQAYHSKLTGEPIKYTAAINQAALSMPEGLCNMKGQGRLWVWGRA